MTACLQKIQTPGEIDNRIMLGQLPPSAHYHLPQDCHSHRQDGLPSLVCSDWPVGSCPQRVQGSSLPQGRFGACKASSEDGRSRQNPQFWVGLVRAS